MIDSFATIYRHVAQTLPDSLPERRKILVALHSVLKESHPARSLIAAQLAAINTLENLQTQLPLKFQPNES